MITFNESINFEVAVTAIAAAQLPGVALVVDPAGKVATAAAGASAGAGFDALLISEVVDATTYLQRYYIYTEIDFGPYVQIGEMVSVAKGWRGLTVNGLKLVSPAAALALGAQLEIAAGGQFQLKSANPAVGRVIEASALNALYSNAVHLY